MQIRESLAKILLSAGKGRYKQLILEPDLCYPQKEISAECLCGKNGEGDQQIGEGSEGAEQLSGNTGGTQERSLKATRWLESRSPQQTGCSGTSHV